ncbi:prophage tail fiber N-terminal domain-containing protein, partial [Yersinia enterocolitica]|uniref:prophage tail fiber N-terminal domain-containing protein n=1 Tax=Yersinia enterocolitica TaxID=630 RepID=UPI001C610FBA
MSVKISGALIDGAGIPMSGCQIILKARVNTAEVVMRTIATITTDGNGEYSFDAQVGRYCVYLRHGWSNEYCVGDISVYDASKPGTLNDFLIALDEGDLKPDVVKRFEELVAQAQQSADMAAESAQQVSQSVQDVTKVKDDAKRYAADAQTSATAAAESQSTAAESEKRAASSAHSATQSAQNAQESKEAAQQAAQNAQNCRNEVEEVANNLANEVQTKAPLDSPALTGTPTAPTPDISATGGEVATAEFVKQAVSALVDSSPEALNTLNELADALGNDPNFATTMTNALAGKQPLSAILTSLSGLATAGNKLPYFSNKNMMALTNLSAVGRVMIGQNSKNEVLEYLGLKKYVADALRATTGNAWGSPNVGGLIFAAYCGESDDDNNRTLIRGKVIPGSR